MFTFNRANTFCIDGCDTTATTWSSRVPSILVDPFVNNDNLESRAVRQSHLQIWRHVIDRDLEYALVYENFVSYSLPLPRRFDVKWSTIRLDADGVAYIVSNFGARWLNDTYGGRFATLEQMMADPPNSYDVDSIGRLY
jgi:hypothetical protein